MQKIVKEYAIVTVSTLLIATATYFFMLPSNVIVGSISGLSIILSNFIPIPMSAILFIFNVLILIIGFIFLGREFGAKTVYAAIMIPTFLSVWEMTFPNNQSFTGDVLIDMISYLLIVGIAQALLFHINASSGGIDVIAKLLNKYLHVDLGRAMILSGMCIAVASIVVYDTKSLILGILATYGNGIILDNYINGFNRQKRVCILSNKHKEIRDFIMQDLNRGVTMYQAVGGFKNDEHIEIITILTRSEYGALMKFIGEVDENAFVTVSTVNEVIGNWKKHKRRGA